MPVPILTARSRRTLAALTGAGVLGALTLTALPASSTTGVTTPPGPVARAMSEQGDPDAGDESFEAATAAEQFAQARTAPGIVAPGAYQAAYQSIQNVAATPGSWKEVTNVPYMSDDPYFRDYYSNSGTGDVQVTGRITGIAADTHGHVFAAGANGGVWRSSSGKGHWQSIADGLPSLSSGALRLNGDQLWYATGEANTGGTAYAGDGVYALDKAVQGQFTVRDKVGGTELDSTVINNVVFGGGRAYAATNRGVWSHSTDLVRHRSDPWTLEYAPNPDYLPAGLGAPSQYAGTGKITAGDTNAAYANVVNDIVVDPKKPGHLIAAIGWRGPVIDSVGNYNGFYEFGGPSGSAWTKVVVDGIDGNDVGNTTFAYSADGSKLYAMVQSLDAIATGADSYLMGIFVSPSGSLDGPWTKIADADTLAGANAAVGAPGSQSWYNQFLVVDPKDPKHLYAGLEEVYETKDGGATWTTPGPYWNFVFPCWGGDLSDAVYKTPTAGCPSTTHPDQHDAAIGVVAGVPTFFAGNDGGIYSRPVDGKADSHGHATDWTTLNDGSIDGLQYYGIGIGAAKASTINALPDQATQHFPTTGPIVSGGMQDNGGSIQFSNGRMSSNFGGDGGDVLVDPNDGCNIVQEYVYLSMRVTNSCAQASDFASFVDTSAAHTRDIGLEDRDPSPRFIAPFGADQNNIDHWVAGGRYIWAQGNGFKIQDGDEWHEVGDTGAGHSITALASSDDVVYAGWCGTCNNAGFARGLTRVDVSYKDGVPTGKVTQLVMPKDTSIPNRYIGGIAIDPKDANTVYLAINGFSRRFTEGPGAGIGHVYKSTDGGQTWADVSANLPDVPANSLKVTTTGALVLGTDLGAFYRAPAASSWVTLGKALPLTTVMDVELYHGDVYVGTHGRGIWTIPIPQGGGQSPYAPSTATAPSAQR